MTGLEKEMSMGILFWEGHVAEKWEEDAETAYEREVSFHRYVMSFPHPLFVTDSPLSLGSAPRFGHMAFFSIANVPRIVGASGEYLQVSTHEPNSPPFLAMSPTSSTHTTFSDTNSCRRNEDLRRTIGHRIELLRLQATRCNQESDGYKRSSIALPYTAEGRNKLQLILPSLLSAIICCKDSHCCTETPIKKEGEDYTPLHTSSSSVLEG
ncbi:hypothetical protein M422DRAFT_246034 [Sphaerobolus stellatus SS14]|nr:hypothetical protein M422DRAFT_246034 [Sphaerobolus stellatus SS14]